MRAVVAHLCKHRANPGTAHDSPAVEAVRCEIERTGLLESRLNPDAQSGSFCARSQCIVRHNETPPGLKSGGTHEHRKAHAFEVAADGTFYLSLRGRREGDGLVAISADASTCTVVSRWGGLGHDPGGGAEPVPPPEPIGEGVDLQFPVQGLLAHDGQLFGVSNDDLYSLDLDTGRRTRASYTDGVYSVMGFSNVFWDPSRDVVWAVGTVAKFVGAIIDLETGRRESVFSDTGFEEYADEAILRSSYGEARSVTSPPTMLGSNANSIGMGGFILDPDIVFAVLKSGGLMMRELSTFNNFVHSW